MPHRGDCKHTALLTNTGEITGHVDDLEQLWLETETGSTGNVNDLWMEIFLANGATSGDFNDAADEFLQFIGVTAAALPDMWTEFWCVFGGIITPPETFNVIDGLDNVVDGADNVVDTF
jgi:hypothetical protein